jgi:MFS family permease
MTISPASLDDQILQNRDKRSSGSLPVAFRWLWGGQAISLTGSQLSLLSFQLIATNELHANEVQMGVLTAVQSAPYVLCGLFVGTLVDRFSRFRILVTTDTILCGILIAASILNATGQLKIQLMWVIVGATSTLSLAFDAALSAHLTELIDRKLWLKANSRLSITTSGSAVAGPGIAGYVLQIISASLAMSMDAVTYMVSAMCMILSRSRPATRAWSLSSHAEQLPRTGEHKSILGAIKDGVSLVYTDPLLKIFAFATTAWNLACGGIMSVLVLYAVRTLGMTSGWVGFVMAAAGLGGLIGGATANIWAIRWSRGRVVIVAPLVAACGAAMLLEANGHLSVPIVSVSMFLFNAGQSAFGVMMITCRQEVTPRELLGRMDTTMRVSITGMASVGALLGGFVASRVGIRTTIASGVFLLFIVVLGLKLSSLEHLVNRSRRMESRTM